MDAYPGSRLLRAVCGTALLGLLAACGHGGTAPAGPPSAPADLATLQLALEAALAAAGKSSAALEPAGPAGADNLVFDLTLRVVNASGQPVEPGSPQATHLRLRWSERLQGDYDQNGEVNLSDLVPLSQHFKRLVVYDDPALHEGFASWPAGAPSALPQGNPAINNWRLAAIDGDGNGELNLADVKPIARHWGEVLEGYVLERGVNRGAGGLEWDAEPLDAGFGRQPSAPRSQPAAGLPASYSLLLPLAEAQLEQSFRLRAWNSAQGAAATVCASTSYLPSLQVDRVAPLWDGPAGPQQLIPDNGRLQVQFGTAHDAQSPPVRYRVYWQAGSSTTPALDYAAADWADTLNQSYTITGLDNARHYWVGVRAFDAAAEPNMELNAVLLGRRPGPRDKHAPYWPEGMPAGIGDLLYGNGLAIVSWTEALDLTTDSFGEWSSGPVNYYIYYGPGTEPDWNNAAIIDIAAGGTPAYVRPLTGLDTSQPHWFAVRARDRAEFVNEDDNTNYRVGWPSTTHDTLSAFPGAGPGVPSPRYVNPQPRFAYTPARDSVRLCIESATAQARWMSLYRIDSAGFTHEADHEFARLDLHPQYRLQALALDSAQRLRLLFTSSRQFEGAHVLFEYSAASGQSTEYMLANGPDLMSAEYGPDGELHAFWLELTNPDLENLQFTTYYSGLPLSTARPVYVSGTLADEYLAVHNSSWAWLADGSVAVLGQMTSLGAGEDWKAIVSVPPSGDCRISHAPYPFLDTGTSTYRLATRSAGRAITCDWGINTVGVPVAQMRQLKSQRSLGHAAGFTQLYLAHPEQGPALTALDWDNFAAARTLSTTLQSGAAGAERVYRCLHGCWQGRETIIPLPAVQPGEHLYPLELLPEGLVLCRVEGAGGARALLVDLAPAG